MTFDQNRVRANSAATRERCLSKVIIDLGGPRAYDDAPCWLWTGRMGKDGYGLVWDSLSRKSRVIHRVVWEALRSAVPVGMQLDHLCRVRHCVNPAHLEPVTCQINLLRGNTLNAANKAKTHCDRGHEFTPANTYLYRGGRTCRTCKRETGRIAARARRARARAFAGGAA